MPTFACIHRNNKPSFSENHGQFKMIGRWRALGPDSNTGSILDHGHLSLRVRDR